MGRRPAAAVPGLAVPRPVDRRAAVAAAVAPVGVLGAAGAAAWAVHRKRVQEREDAVKDEDAEL